LRTAASKRTSEMIGYALPARRDLSSDTIRFD